MTTVIIVCATVVVIALVIGGTTTHKEQIKQDAIYKTAELAITNKARKANVYSMSYSRYFYRSSDEHIREDRHGVYDTGFKNGFEACKKAVLTEILKEESR